MFSGSSCTQVTGTPRRVGRQRGVDLALPQRVELLEAHDRDVVAPGLLAGRQQVVVDLAAAHEHAPHALGVDGVVGRTARKRPGELVERRDGFGWRSRLLGVMTTSGLRHGRSTWRRRRWNICAGVVG
jgi:hypothetical protein